MSLGFVLGLDVPGEFHGGFAILNPRTERFVKWGTVEFLPSSSERMHYRQFGRLLDRWYHDYGIRLVVIEQPFLYRIAQRIGAVKFWVARKRGVRWYMITTASARKLIFGTAKFLGEKPPTGARAAYKRQVLERMLAFIPDSKRDLSQHEADAMLYALAGAKAIREGEQDASSTAGRSGESASVRAQGHRQRNLRTARDRNSR